MAAPIKVLVIENSENDAILMIDCLETAGYQVDWWRVDSAPGLKAALASPEPWDLILSDYTMPGFGALQALDLYKRSGLDIPFLLISGSIGEERAVEAMRSGAHDYIMKDHMRRLAPAVERELRESANRAGRRKTTNENVRLNAELIELNDKLREKIDLLARTNSDLEQMTWAASHNLKEPLRIIGCYTDLLLRERASSSPDEIEFSRYIGAGVERATALLDGLIAYAQNLKVPPDDSVEADAEAAAREAARNLHPAIEKRGASITIGPLPAVRMAHNALRDVFQQLFLNALEYHREGIPSEVLVSGAHCGPLVRIAVTDNGLGIKPEYQAQIFELFRRLHGTERPGIGVGLPLCRRLIENYGGRLWVESQPGAGSTFYFTLGAADQSAAASA